jgi:hypothetical protein
MLKDMAFSFFLSFLTGGASAEIEKQHTQTKPKFSDFQKNERLKRQNASHTRASCTAAAAGRWPLDCSLAIHVLARFGLNLFGQRIGQARRFCERAIGEAAGESETRSGRTNGQIDLKQIQE